MDGVVGWWVLIHSGHTSKTHLIRGFLQAIYYSASHELVVGARKETKLLGKELTTTTTTTRHSQNFH
jgi:hypothetical protein